MTRSLLFCATLLLAGAAHAEDGFSLGIGADYSSGDYGSDITTEILSVPVTARFNTGDWSFRASLPWLRVDGDPNVLPGVGLVDNLNPVGRGRGGLVTPPPSEEEQASGSASGIGDLTLAATYSVPTGGPFGVDLTANAKIATADEDKGLGTGANDFGAAVDLYRDFDGTMLFGGVGYTMLGESTYVDVDGVMSANVGVSQKVGAAGARLGVAYDHRQSAASGFDDRQEMTGFYSVPTGNNGRFQVYALKGLSDGSPDWGAGVSFSAGF